MHAGPSWASWNPTEDSAFVGRLWYTRLVPRLRSSALLHVGLAAGLLLTLACQEGEGFVQLSPPLLLVNVDQVEFGPVPVGFQITRRLTLANGGDVALHISALSTEGDAAFTVPAGTPTIEPGAEQEILLTFTPPGAAAYAGALVIDSDASNAAQKSVPLSGTGIPPTQCGNCDSPPSTTCLSVDDSVSYAETGVCVMNECEYTATVTACPAGCVASTGRCAGELPDAGLPEDSGVTPDAAADAGVILDAEPEDTGDPDLGVNPDAEPTDTGPAPDSGPACADAGVTDSGLGAPSALFGAPGVHSFVVPAGVNSLRVRAWGGGGQGGNQAGATGGGGAFVQADLPVTPGETLELLVAEGGGNVGGPLGNGAGATYVRRSTTDLVVAAGGGGGGSDGNSGNSMAGGAGGGGGPSGQPGGHGLGTIATYCTQVTGGTGGTPTGPGLGGTTQGTAANHCDGQPGARNVGGRSTGTTTCITTPGAQDWQSGGGQSNGGGGGGGAGYFGGGGSGFIWTYCGAGGGGGASWADPAAQAVVQDGAQGPLQGRATESYGAGRGGERCQQGGGAPPCLCNPGAPGRVELYY